MIRIFLLVGAFMIAGCQPSYQGDGNLHDYVSKKAPGYHIRWNMHAHYDVTPYYEEQFKNIHKETGNKVEKADNKAGNKVDNPSNINNTNDKKDTVSLEVALLHLAKAMSYDNINRQLTWTQGAYPYQNIIVLARCEKNTIVFTEVGDSNLFYHALDAGKYPGCRRLESDLQNSGNSINNTNNDNSSNNTVQNSSTIGINNPSNILPGTIPIKDIASNDTTHKNSNSPQGKEVNTPQNNSKKDMPVPDGKNIISMDANSALPLIGDPDREVPEPKNK